MQVSFNFVAAVTITGDFGAKENKIYHCFHFFLIHLPWSDGTGCHDLRFWMLSFKPAFSLSFTLIKKFFSSSSLSAIILIIQISKLEPFLGNSIIQHNINKFYINYRFILLIERQSGITSTSACCLAIVILNTSKVFSNS